MLGARRRSDTVLVSTITDADQGSADVAFRTPLAPYEKSKFLGSGGSMVARLKLKGIDGRAPPGVNLRKDHCRTLETERPENDETPLSVGGSLSRFRACRFPWLCVPSPVQDLLRSRSDRAHSFRISPNPGTKSVKEHATKQSAFANPETVFVRK
ncbi:hypothetical protein Bca4012_103291 [Brassica carinata]